MTTPPFQPPTSQSLPPGLPGNLGLPPVANLYIDGMPLSALSSPNADVNTSSGHDTNEGYFWSTPQRFPDSVGTEDVFEVSFTDIEKVNSVSFQLARFPHVAYLEYFDGPTQNWIQAIQDNGLPVQVAINDSLPSVCWTAPSDTSHTHPQHFGTGHWVTYQFRVMPVKTSQLRIRLVRSDSGLGPADPFGTLIPYSLGVKDFQCGYTVSSIDDLPIAGESPDSVRESLPIATSTDVLGSPVQFVVRTNKASELVHETGIWKCTPQPVSNAVVSLYADMRTPSGKGQVADRIYMNPVFSGCTVNMYYSNDDQNSATFQASDAAISNPHIQVPVQVAAPTLESSGLSFQGGSSLVIDNTVVQFDQSQAFQMGIIFNTIFPSTDLTPRTVYDDGNLSIKWGPSLSLPVSATNDPNPPPDTGDGTIDSTPPPTPANPSTIGAFTIKLGSTLICLPLTFTAGTSINLYLTWDGSSLRVDMPIDPLVGHALSVGILNFNPSDAISIGGALGSSAATIGRGDITLRSLIIKSGNPDDYLAMQSFWKDPDAFVRTPEIGQSPTTSNAILRFSALNISANNPWGFVGGPAVEYENINWTPITRNYQLVRGYYDFEPIQCRFLKLEFSNLSPQPYETSSTVNVEVKLFPTNTAPLTGVEGPSNQAQKQNLDIHAEIAGWNRFADQVVLATNNGLIPYAGQSYLPTEAKFAKDPQTAALLDKNALYWNFDNQHQSPNMPQFTLSGKHVYKTVVVPFDRRVAYFVALSDFRVFRRDITTNEDTDHWVELFYDDQYIEVPDPTSTWQFNDPDFTSGVTTPDQMVKPAVIQSPILNSYRMIRGFQFATTQSPAAQLLPDSEFTDASLQHWKPYGSAVISSDSFYDKNVGGVAKVVIDGSQILWSLIEQTFSSWQAIEDLNPSPYLPRWEDMESRSFSALSGGITNVDPITPSSVGRIFVAARVLTPNGLTGPLNLDLINGDGSLLARAVANVGSNKMTEFFLEYRIGDQPIEAATWDQVCARGSWNNEQAVGDWDQVADITLPPVECKNMTVSLYQDGVSTASVWYVDSLAFFDDAILWEFSRDGGQNFYPVFDIRNDSSGVFIFPSLDAASTGNGSQFIWRLTGGAPDQNVSSLVIRPWYDSLLFGTRPTRLNTHGGPNLSPYDHFPEVQDDPRFKMWSSPIPREWFFAFKQLLGAELGVTKILPPAYASDNIPSGVNEGMPPAPSSEVIPVSIVYGV